MKKIIPAVWFQNKLDPVPRSPARPRVLELFESELAQVSGGGPIDTFCGNTVLDDVLWRA
jgi:hypothetical protein